MRSPYLLLLFVLSLGISGCPDPNDDDSSPSESQTPFPATPTPPPVATPTATLPPVATPTPAMPPMGTPTPEAVTPTHEPTTPTPGAATPTPVSATPAPTPTHEPTTPTPGAATPTPASATPAPTPAPEPTTPTLAPPTPTPAPETPTPVPDRDGDGYTLPGGDCDDENSDVYPGAPERCNDLDDDCDSSTGPDCDEDGVSAQQGDCDDGDPEINPAAVEECDGADNDCDGEVDEQVLETFWSDEDGDGYGDDGQAVEACELSIGLSDNDQDCDDRNPDANPAGNEVCDDNVDQDCDGADLSCGDVDDDLDGFTENEGDCNDGNDSVYPEADEVCNSVDEDCDGEADDGVTVTFYPDVDGDEFGIDEGALEACEAPEGHADVGGDCDDGDPEINPDAQEVCGNETDEDCDGRLGTAVIYTLPVEITDNTGVDQAGLPVRFSFTDSELTAPLAAAPESLRIYALKTDTPYAEPYAGVPFHRETVSPTEAIVWISIDLPAAGSAMYYLYFGDPLAPDVDDTDAIFEYFEDFTDGVDDWVQESSYSGTVVLEASPSQYHSSPFGMRNYMEPPGSCQGAHWAYSGISFDLGAADLYTFAFYTRSSACSGCTMYSRVFLDESQIHNVYDPGPDLHYNAYLLNLDAGAHALQAGIYTTQMCSGIFQASHDDFMLARAVDPAPSVTVLLESAVGACW